MLNLKKLTAVFAALTLLGGLVVIAMADETADQSVTVTVELINEITTSGILTLTISTATAGSEPGNASNNSTCSLAWTANGAGGKITVGTSVSEGTQKFSLTVDVEGTVTGGTAPGTAVSLAHGAGAADFITGIVTTTGGCDLEYIASATAAQGAGTDTHTITFTITSS